MFVYGESLASEVRKCDDKRASIIFISSESYSVWSLGNIKNELVWREARDLKTRDD